MENTLKDVNKERRVYDAPRIATQPVQSDDVIVMSAGDGDNWTDDDFS